MNLRQKSKNIANNALRLLLGGAFSRNDWDQTDWNLLAAIARKNVILIRIHELLERNGIIFPEKFSEEVQKEKNRVLEVIKTVKKVSRLCAESNITILLPSVLQHYPDMGGDVDLVAPDGSRRLDSLLIDRFQAKPLPRNLFGRISTESSYYLPSPGHSVEIHHGRQGLVGEHYGFVERLFNNKQNVSFCGMDIPVPSDEDYLLLQTILRLYGRCYFRISDLVSPILLIKHKNIDRNYLFETASRIGISDGLSIYLGFLDKIYHDFFNCSILSGSIKKMAGVNHFSFKKSYYRYSALLITGRLYASKMIHDILSARFASAFRLCLIPCVTSAYLLQNLRGRRSRFFDPYCL